jgi:hypothetical protein
MHIFSHGCSAQIDPPKGNFFITRNSSAKFVTIISSQPGKHDVFGDISTDIRDTSVPETIFNMSDTEVEDDFVFPGNIAAHMLYTSGTHFF